MPTTTISTTPSTQLSGFASTIPGRVLLGLAATAVVALAAHIAIPLHFTPVPFIMTPLAVLGVGLAFGPVAGFLTMLAYLAEGAMGLPVFSPTGPGGLAQLLGPTGGYLISYPLVAALVGGLVKPLSRLTPRSLAAPNFFAALFACNAGILVLFLVGAGWFMNFTNHSLYATWIGSVAPFLPGEEVKALAAAGIYSTLKRSARS